MLTMFYRGICTALVVMFSLSCAAKTVRSDSLWREYHLMKDGERRTAILFEIGDAYYAENNRPLRDSVFQLMLAQEYMQPGASDAPMIAIYNWYFGKEYALGNSQAIDYAGRMEAAGKHGSNPRWLYDAYLLFYRIYFSQNKPQLALDYAGKANWYANSINKDNLKSESLLALGQCHEVLNNKIEAFRNYKDALYIAYNINDDELLFDAYGKLSSFFRVIRKYDEAKEYKQKQFTLLTGEDHIDSARLMRLYCDFANILFDNKVSEQPEQISAQVIAYAYRHNDEDLKTTAFTIYRSYLVENNLFAKLSDLYIRRYPEEFKKIAENTPTVYYRLKAYIEEAEGSYDSSAYYYRLSEDNIMKSQGNNVYVANFFRRYGQFLLRKRDTPLAKEKFEQCYRFALQARYFPYIIEATANLESISFGDGKFTAAYEYEKLNRRYTDSQANAAKQDELLLMEIDNKNRQVELAEVKRKEAIERRHNIEYVAIILFISVLFTVLVMLGYFKVPKIVIKSMGFLSFIFFFEFIIMITDKKVEHYTHGEPWKFLLFKIAIISILAPLHHWLEHKVISYLYDHKLIDSSKVKFRKWLASFVTVKKARTRKPKGARAEKKSEVISSGDGTD